MLVKRIIHFLFLLAVVVIAWYFLQPKKTGKRIDKFTKYELVKNWPALAGSFTLGNPATGFKSSGKLHPGESPAPEAL
jgi:hypothetical protein